MKLKTLALAFTIFGCTLYGYSQNIYPSVQSIAKTNLKTDLSKGISIQTAGESDPVALDALKALLKENKKGVKVYIGEVGDKSLKKFDTSEIPAISGAYYLKTSPKEIVIIGHDDRGTFYGVQTLRQLLSNDSIEQVKIIDYPEVLFRGSVEGFYGKPWSHADRLSQLKFYGENKLNTYIYGPKDDPYHSSLSNHGNTTKANNKGSWREPYPEKEAQQIKELAETAKKYKVDFVWAIHPGADIKWNEEDYQILIKKLEHMYDLGVRSFAVFFDDINGQGTIEGHRQSGLLNRINNEFVKVKGDVTPLILCPTEYNKSWADPKPGGYLPILGKNLDPSIQVMWTGDRVCADITMETLNWINERIMRPTYIWWNFPVTDYVSDRVLLGPSYGLATEAGAKDMAGFTSNPMENAEASKIALFGVADYTWNPKAYNYLTAWNQALKVIMPSNYEAYRTLAIHSADIGPSGHNYRRDESWETNTFDPMNYKQAEFDALKSEFQKIAQAPAKIRNNKDNVALVAELSPWLDQFEVLGNRGLQALELIKIYEKGNITNTWTALLDNEMTQKQKVAFNKHKSGTLKLRPFVAHTYDTIIAEIFKAVGGENTTKEVSKINTNINQVAGAALTTQGDTIYIKPMLEVIKIAPKGYIAVELPVGKQIREVNVDLGIKDATIEYSVDGINWTTTIDGARFTRFANNTNKPINAKLNRFEVYMLGTKEGDMSAAFDGDLSQGVNITKSAKFGIETGNKNLTIFCGKNANLTISFIDNKGQNINQSKLSSFNQIAIPTNASAFEITGNGELREVISTK